MLELEKQELLNIIAYQLWVERGKPFGSPELDWERAEQLLPGFMYQRAKELDTASGVATGLQSTLK